MLSEEDVIEAVCDFLKERGYEIEQQLGPTEHGYDIIAKKGVPLGMVSMYVEAKGATSSKNTSNRFGRAFNASQVRTHISVAMYKACEVLSLLTWVRISFSRESHCQMTRIMAKLSIRLGLH